MEVSTNLGRVCLVPKGEYDPAAQYERLDVVRYEGAGYLVLRAVQGVTPAGGADYMLLVERGAVGPQGIQGNTGPQGEKGEDGTSFIIKGRFDTLEELTAAHPAGAAGDAYAVGTAEDNSVYLWSVDMAQWQDIGPMQGPPGPQGVAGAGVPTGGAAGQMLVKKSGSDYDTEWVDAQLSGGTTVTSFNGRDGAVVPQAGDYTAADVGAATLEQVNAAIQTAILDSWEGSY